MAVFFARSTGNALVPNSRAAALVMERLPRNTPIRVEAKVPRNGKQHRLFWAFSTLVADALNDGPAGEMMAWDAERVVERLKLATGHVELCALPKHDAERLGCTHVARAKSISFAAMGGDDFGRFMDAAFAYVRDTLCVWIEGSPHWADIQTILRESHMLGEDAA